jgi:hypothetical protein
LDVILFKKDWNRFPTAVVDYQTSNKSFLRTVALYKKQGIDNCEFILALLQPELSGVDPFDPNLSKEMQFKIAMECKFNPWYYLREVALIPPTGGTVPIRFRANRGNIALYWSFFNHVDFGLLQPRQTGKSVSTDVLMNGLINIWCENTTVNLITKDIKLRNANVSRLKDMRDLLPSYIYLKNALDADNQELITNIRLGNSYKTAVGRNDKKEADKLGRGLTVPIMQFDELSYINWIEMSLPVALSSGSAARYNAAEAGQPYGNIFTTTAGSVNSRDGKYAYQFMTGGAPWTEHYFDQPNNKALKRIIEKNSPGEKPLIYGAFNHRQLGKTDEWLYKELRETASTGELADRDYFNIWTAGTEGGPLNADEKRFIKESGREPEYTEISAEGYIIRWYIAKDEIVTRMSMSTYVIGIDPSEALGQNNDATGFVMIDTETHDVVCTGRYNETSLPVLAGFIGNFLLRYSRATLVIERKSSGIALLDMLIIQLTKAGVDPFRRLYNRIVDEREEFANEYREIQTPVNQRHAHFYDRFKRYFGFNTSGSGGHARSALFGDAFKSLLEYGIKRVKDNILINEMLSLVIKNGRLDHSSGNHDDMVVSLLLAHWFCIRAKNLDYYGIDARRVFAKALKREEEMTKVEVYRDERQAKLRAEFTAIMEELKSTKDMLSVARLEMRLRRLSQQVDVAETGGVGIDAMLQQAHGERLRKLRTKRFAPSHGMRMAA